MEVVQSLPLAAIAARILNPGKLASAAFRWKDGQVYLAKCSEPLPIRWSRQLPINCEPTTITVKLDPSGRWFVSLRIDDLTDGKLKAVDSVIGLDVGISSLVTLSTGEKITNPKGFNKHHQKLRKAQKALSKHKKNSRNRDKARLKVARIHAIISDSRKDHLHQLTTRLVRENQTIVVEDLAVVNMVKNSKLARSISDAAWGELIRQLDYKCQWYGRTLVKIDRWFPSSKRCGHCGHVVDKLPLSIREWTCPKCETVHDRDINAARNILAAGLAVLAGNSEDVCESSISPNRHSSKGQLRKTRKGKKQKLKS